MPAFGIHPFDHPICKCLLLYCDSRFGGLTSPNYYGCEKFPLRWVKRRKRSFTQRREGEDAEAQRKTSTHLASLRLCVKSLISIGCSFALRRLKRSFTQRRKGKPQPTWRLCVLNFAPLREIFNSLGCSFALRLATCAVIGHDKPRLTLLSRIDGDALRAQNDQRRTFG
jgi:hypothetical protein